MRRAITLALLLAVSPGCESFGKIGKHLHSGMTGLHRRVTLYANDGTVIQQWEGKFMVEATEDPCLSWIGDDGLEIKVMGTVLVEELP